MRSEHNTTWDEWDLMARHSYARFTRAGVAKKIKRASHRADRRVGKAQAGEEGFMSLYRKGDRVWVDGIEKGTVREVQVCHPLINVELDGHEGGVRLWLSPELLRPLRGES